MNLLILFFSVSVGISFLCSILEAVLLSLNMPYISLLEKTRPNAGKLLKQHIQDISKPIASILILNTMAHTLGAAGVGAQAEIIFGSSAVFYVSTVLTFAILFFSEIIPKTIGTLYWKELAPASAYIIRFFIWLTFPIILLTQFVTDKISKNKSSISSLSKAELLESTLLSEDDGAIDEIESDIIENILLLDAIKVKEILTPRSVIYALEENTPIKNITENDKLFQFSRIPIYKDSIDTITGIVMTKKIFWHMTQDDSVPLKEIKEEIFTINENVPVSKALDLFIKKKEHMFVVADSYDQTEGILTLEDCVETLLGVEIMDESDDIEDMQAYAKLQMKMRRKRESQPNKTTTE